LAAGPVFLSGRTPKQFTPNLVAGLKYPPFTPGRPHSIRLAGSVSFWRSFHVSYWVGNRASPSADQPYTHHSAPSS
jgi:hypothetical protein